jgi:hypothetical protein
MFFRPQKDFENQIALRSAPQTEFLDVFKKNLFLFSERIVRPVVTRNFLYFKIVHHFYFSIRLCGV